ncbi:MAG TPA: TIGR02678 family protein [Ktedonobacteraceae bacterium]|nr:TIGR02678 family protein [Ktedonobacteraceae bacterium]
MIEEKELLDIEKFAEIINDHQPSAIPQGYRATSLTTARRRISTADLMKAHLALMEKEVILPKQSDLFRLVKYHFYALQSWHDQHTGWRIQRDASAIRLIRNPGITTVGYLYDRLKEPGDFACLTWILWYAENRQLSGRGNDQLFLLSQLAEQIQEQSASGPASERKFDFRKPADRYSIQRALQYLEDLGGLQLVDGQTRDWVEQTASADALYEFTDVVRSLIVALNPQLVTMVADQLKDNSTILQPSILLNPAGVEISPLVRAWRTLLLGPALFRFDDPSAFAELLAHADALAYELLETFGWLLDIHRDYACIIRASGMTTGPVTSLTPFGTNDQIAMLLCKAIRDQVDSGAWSLPDAYGCLHVTTEDMSELFYRLRERYGENWGSEARNRSSRSLLNDVYRKMRQAGLLRGPDDEGNLLVLPTAARYIATYEKAGQETKDTAKDGAKKSESGKQKSSSSRKTTVIALPEFALDEG